MAIPSESTPLIPAEPSIERPWDSKTLVQRDDSSSTSSSSSTTTTTTTTTTVQESSPFDITDILRDVIIGFSDGLTVPFALTAGLSSLGSSKIVIMGGLAELFSGMISMGLGAYLAAVTERDHYQYEEQQQLGRHLDGCVLPEEQRDDVFCILEKYNVSRAAATPLVEELCKNREQWIRFRMDFSLRLEKPNIHRAWISGLTMGLSYFIGGLIPMIPYFVMDRVREALIMSIAVTVVILLGFGYVKNYVAIRNHRAGLWGAVQTLIIGILAAGTSYAIVKALDTSNV